MEKLLERLVKCKHFWWTQLTVESQTIVDDSDLAIIQA
jgi:hypothetical protein